MSIGYAIGAIIGGAFAPLIADLIFAQTKQSWTIGLYILIVTVISLIAVSTIKAQKGANLNTTSVEVHGS